MRGERKMSDATPIKRHVTPPSWLMRPDGSKRQLEKARWNHERIAEVFIDEPNTDFSVDDLARLVYGSNGKKNRENVRKHIPAQRNYMLARLVPIVTSYGVKGRILRVKLYDKAVLNDRRAMLEELDRLRSRRELTDERYKQMCGFLGL
jgi:hypothetical protein